MDKYDRAVLFLKKHPSEITRAWFESGPEARKRAHCLFQYVTPTGKAKLRSDGRPCGCLTQVKIGCAVAWTEALTQAIRTDVRIPSSYLKIRAEDLPIFAEWQRKLDRLLERR